jgi:hypothetical protein
MALSQTISTQSTHLICLSRFSIAQEVVHFIYFSEPFAEVSSSPELLRAQGIITGPDVNAQTGGRSEVNDQRRTMRDGSSAMGGPSRIPVKQEETESRTQRIRALQVSYLTNYLINCA